MRIVAGMWRGRRITAPKGLSTRPTSDRVRESVFSMIESRMRGGMAGASVLDLFAGTGAMGLEALSRGARDLVAVERDAAALRALSANVDALGAGDMVTALKADAFSPALSKRLPDSPFTLLFLDPPYRITTSATKSVLQRLAEAGTVGADALAVWEHASTMPAEWPEGFEEVVTRRFGTTCISIARFNEEVDGS